MTRWLRAHADWFAYAAVAFACTAYLNGRAALVARWGEWYGAIEAGHPHVVLQVRAFLSGRLASLPNPLATVHDYSWGRGGMHTLWGLGVAILAIPFHLLGRALGAPGFPDDVRFLILYATTTFVLARALHRASPARQGALTASLAAAGFVMVLPSFVGMVSTRFLIFEQTIATGALWSIVLLAGTLSLLTRPTRGTFIALCAMAGFAIFIRPTFAVYGATTVVLAVIIGRRGGLSPRVLIAGLAAYLGVQALDATANFLRFGSPWVFGYENTISGYLVNRLTRWGLSFTKGPFLMQVKETFATLFLIDPPSGQTMTPPPSVLPYVQGERWREYYSPTFDLYVCATWIAALAVVAHKVATRRLWLRGRDLREEVLTVVGIWALVPSIVLFVFYARISNMVTRYAIDLYPAFAAAGLCVGMAIVEAVRKRAPERAASAQLAIAGTMALYIGGWPCGASHMSTPVNANVVTKYLGDIDSAARAAMPAVPHHFECGAPRGPAPVHTQLEEWHADCTFLSGMVFAMPHDRCVAFTLRPSGAGWEAADDHALAGFRARADFDELVSCGAPAADGDARRVTMCDPHTPSFLLEGLRLYAVAALDPKLNPLDRLRLMRIEGTPSCP